MKFFIYIFFIFIFTSVLCISLSGQTVLITDDPAYTENSKSMLDIKSTTKGLLIPRMADPNVIVAPPDGLLAFNTTSHSFWFYKAGTTNAWMEIGTTVVPGGLDGYVQFNDGGTFGGDQFFYWDKTNYRLILGINTSPAALTITNIDKSAIRLKPWALGTSEMQFEEHGMGGQFIGLRAPENVPADLSFILPATDGINDQVLSTDGTGNLTFTSKYWNRNTSLVPATVHQVNLTDRLGVGVNTALCNMHLYENSNNDFAPMFLLQQQGANADASIYFNNSNSSNDLTFGIDGTDNFNFKISNTGSLTGNTYADANTMLRVHTEAGSQGIVDINHQSRMRAYRNANQSVPDGTATTVIFNVENFDEQGEYNPLTGRFTAKEDGYYQVNARVEFDALGAYSGFMRIEIDVDGAVVAYGTLIAVTQINDNNIQVSDLIHLTAGQFIEIKVFQNPGSNRDISVGSYKTYLSIHKSS